MIQRENINQVRKIIEMKNIQKEKIKVTPMKDHIKMINHACRIQKITKVEANTKTCQVIINIQRGIIILKEKSDLYLCILFIKNIYFNF